MEFRIADTFTASLARLTSAEQNAVKTTAFDLQVDPVNPGMSFHKLDRIKDKNFWSVRAGLDLRIIVHRSASSLLLCYVDHHDKAYAWAERRRLDTHPATGAAQLVEIRETVEEIRVPVYVEEEHPVPKRLLFARETDESLLSYGVPVDWLADVRAADEDTLLDLVDHLPSEAAEALLEVATGGEPRLQAVSAAADPFDHPDALRRFQLLVNTDELEAALEYPWDRWTIFLHPDQRQIVERSYSGPARVSGSAGTGKTIVALHRATFLARRDPDARVLLTTLSEPLANGLRAKLRILLAREPRLGERIDVASLDAVAIRLYRARVGRLELADGDAVRESVRSASAAVSGHRYTDSFLNSEWSDVVDAWQLRSWDEYRDVSRLGRRTRLPEVQRRMLWDVFDRVQSDLASRGLVTMPQVYRALGESGVGGSGPYDHVVIDEAQDLAIAQLRFLSSFVGEPGDGLFFAGDLGQRIFQQPFSWLGLGVDIRGRARTLRVNYRTSHQIRRQADRLLGSTVSDVDGNVEQRAGTVSVFSGPEPVVAGHPDAASEEEAVASWLRARVEAGVEPGEFGLFVRSDAEIIRAVRATEAAGVPQVVLDERLELSPGHACIATMHLAKGLEFRVVAVMACDDDVIPLQARIESVADEGDLQDVYDTERQLLYVACTRARDELHVSGVVPLSEFLEDMAPRKARLPA